MISHSSPITQSQKNGSCWKENLEVLWSNPFAQRGPPRTLPRAVSRVFLNVKVFKYLQRGRLHKLPRQSIPVFHHPHREKVFPEGHREPPVSQFVPTASGLDSLNRACICCVSTLTSGILTH